MALGGTLGAFQRKDSEEEADMHPKLPQHRSQACEGSPEEHTSLHTAKGQAVPLTNSVFPSHLCT